MGQASTGRQGRSGLCRNPSALVLKCTLLFVCNKDFLFSKFLLFKNSEGRAWSLLVTQGHHVL